MRKKNLQKKPVKVDPGKNPVLHLLHSYYSKNCLSSMVLSLKELPPSANGLYDKSVYKNKKTGKSAVNVNLSEQVEIYRILVRNAVRRSGVIYEPRNILAAVIELYGPKWLNKDMTPKRKDADNMIKPLFDSIEKATHIPDENIFQHSPFKLYAEEEKCIITLYEIEPIMYMS